MSYQNSTAYTSEYGQQETWDFRGFFVNYETIAFIEFKQARQIDNYPKMLKILDEIHSEVFGRIRKKWTDKDEIYLEIRSKIIAASNKYKTDWNGKSFSSEGINVFRSLFNEAMGYIFYMIDKNELFGKRRMVAGL